MERPADGAAPLIGTRLELRLNDPVDSVVNRKLAALLRPDQPGRVLTEDKQFAQVSLPVLALDAAVDLGASLEELAARVREHWSGPGAAPIRMLPTRLEPEEVPRVTAEPPTVPFGLRQDTMTAAASSSADGTSICSCSAIRAPERRRCSAASWTSSSNG